MGTLTLKKKPVVPEMNEHDKSHRDLRRQKKRKAERWIKQFIVFKEKLYPFAKGVSQEAESIRKVSDVEFGSTHLKAAITVYCQCTPYLKALDESEYRYKLDGTKLKRNLADEEKIN